YKCKLNTIELTSFSQGPHCPLSDREGRTALHRASERGHTAVALALAKAGADIRATDLMSKTPLHLAAQNGHESTVKSLVHEEKKSLKNQTTVLHMAATEDDATLILLDKGIDPNINGPKDQTPLHLSALHNQPALMALLLHVGAQINSITQDEFTALHLASQSGNTEAVAQLLEGKADIHVKDKQGRTLLLTSGSDTNATEKEKKTPLHLAAKEGHTKAVSALLAGKSQS
uniref:Uncharacterized protein n=1 Tax=Sinocyclocheilus grahami TaxID=75366 RepID=A0A672KAV6_SINGR